MEERHLNVVIEVCLLLFFCPFFGSAMSLVFFYIYPMEMSRCNFLFVRKPEKRGGKRGRTGEVFFFAVPNVHCNPSMNVDIKMLVFTLIILVFFFFSRFKAMS